MLRHMPYSPLVTITAIDGASMIKHGERMGVLERLSHPLGDVIRMNESVKSSAICDIETHIPNFIYEDLLITKIKKRRNIQKR